MSDVRKIDGNEFKDIIADGVVLVDFYADWCMPCKMLSPVIDSVAAEFEGKASVCKLNIDEAPQVAAEYGVMSIPTVIAFKNGQLSEKSVGVVDKSVLADMLNKAMA